MRKRRNTFFFHLAFVLFLSLGLAQPGGAQMVDFSHVVTPEGQRPASFEEYLVQLAWLNNPETQILDYRKNKELKEVELQRSAWKDDLNFEFNLNEVSLGHATNPSDNDLILYPLFQLSTSVSLGTFTNGKKKQQIEQEDVKIAEAEGNQHKLKIRAETLSRYRRLLLAIETLKVRVKAEEDARNIYDMASQRFKTLDLQLDEMLRASASYNSAVESRLSAETDIELATLQMEEILGVKWENAQRYQERYDK
jgi:outer membrane protein TolC